MIFFDTETCGLHGPIVLYQYAKDDEDIILYDVWLHEVGETLELFEELVWSDIVGFNLSYDWFHVCQMYTTMTLLKKDALPNILDYADAEPHGRFGDCLKPKGCLDLMLHARKGPYQSTMDRKPIRIKRVHKRLAFELAEELDKRIQLKDVYFSKNSDSTKRWTIHSIKDENDDTDPDFVDLVLKFNPSSALKALAKDALNVDPDSVKLFSDVELPKEFYPAEAGYAPFALAIGNVDNWNGAWPDVIDKHINHWAYFEPARQYASDDVRYTRDLYHYFGQPEFNDTESILACMVGAVRWRGFAIDIEKIKNLQAEARAKVRKLKFKFGSKKIVRRYLEQVMTPTEQAVMHSGGKFTTKKFILEEISKWRQEDVCETCNGDGCSKCNNGVIDKGEHPAAVRATEILDARRGNFEYNLYSKLLQAGRFHASLNIIGALSGRMSGADDLNAQGITKAKEVRSAFTMADCGLDLCGGDFDSFEVGIGDSVYKDPVLHEQLLQGLSMHGLFGQYLFPPMTYEEICATKGLPGDRDKYSRSKNGVFAVFFGGDENTLVRRVGIALEAAENGYREWCKKYKVWGEKRKAIFDRFCSMRQPGGIGTKVEWSEPDDYMESLLGFRRYFTLENQIVKALFILAENPPKAWQAMQFRVCRRDKEQTICGAARSALFAAAFALQSANMRAAANHEIQSTGAGITKELQRELWVYQPIGIGKWMIQPLNIHDELVSPTDPSIKEDVKNTVHAFVEKTKSLVPLIGMTWKTDMRSWGEK